MAPLAEKQWQPGVSLSGLHPSDAVGPFLGVAHHDPARRIHNAIHEAKQIVVGLHLDSLQHVVVKHPVVLIDLPGGVHVEIPCEDRPFQRSGSQRWPVIAEQQPVSAVLRDNHAVELLEPPIDRLLADTAAVFLAVNAAQRCVCVLVQQILHEYAAIRITHGQQSIHLMVIGIGCHLRETGFDPAEHATRLDAVHRLTFVLDNTLDIEHNLARLVAHSFSNIFFYTGHFHAEIRPVDVLYLKHVIFLELIVPHFI